MNVDDVMIREYTVADIRSRLATYDAIRAKKPVSPYAVARATTAAPYAEDVRFLLSEVDRLRAILGKAAR